MNKQNIKKIFSYYSPYKKDLILDLLCSFIHSVSFTCIPLLVKYAMSIVLNADRTEAFGLLLGVSSVIFLLFVTMALAKKYMKYQGNFLAAKVESDIKKEIFSHYQKQDFDFFDERKIGRLMSYITSDAYNLTIFIKEIPETLLDFMVRFVGVIVVLFLTLPAFGAIVFGVLTFVLAIAFYYMPIVQKKIIKAKAIYSRFTSNLEESLSGIKTVKSFTNENKEIEKFDDDIKMYLKTRKDSLKLSSNVEALLSTIIVGLVPIITVISLFFILNGQSTLSDLITFMLYADILIGALFGMISLLDGFNEGAAGIKRIFDILSVTPKIVDSPNAVSMNHVKGDIKFNNVVFTYKPDKNILNGLNFEIKPGEYVALVGPSGAGKSTICNLIPRFYDVTKGEILIDDVSVNNIKLKDLRKNIGFVQQDTFLFSGTVEENIRYGNLNATKEEIIEAAKNAYADDFIRELKHGYNTSIGQRGTKLSGGQKQRLAIARVFLKNPPILIFDEATSSLDNESEYFIQKSMEKLAENRTTIVIAHRLSTIKNAKRILVLDEGRVVEEGTHDELLSKNGLYSALYNMQFRS